MVRSLAKTLAATPAFGHKNLKFELLKQFIFLLDERDIITVTWWPGNLDFWKVGRRPGSLRVNLTFFLRIETQEKKNNKITINQNGGS